MTFAERLNKGTSSAVICSAVGESESPSFHNTGCLSSDYTQDLLRLPVTLLLGRCARKHRRVAGAVRWERQQPHLAYP
jgi:hypothetical protein